LLLIHAQLQLASRQNPRARHVAAGVSIALAHVNDQQILIALRVVRFLSSSRDMNGSATPSPVGKSVRPVDPMRSVSPVNRRFPPHIRVTCMPECMHHPNAQLAENNGFAISVAVLTGDEVRKVPPQVICSKSICGFPSGGRNGGK
jgi:hypothetical protein